MTHNLIDTLLRKLDAKNHLQEDEYDNVAYFLEVVLINLFKGLQVYTVALLMGTLKETFIMNASYVLLRKYAGGWHAKTSLNCSLISVSLFVGIPIIILKLHAAPSLLFLCLVSLFLIVFVYRYAPADTEKNPLISISDRRNKRKRSLSTLILVLLFMFIYPSPIIKLLILVGLLLELLMIHPLYYRITKRNYNNFQKYVNMD